MDNKGIEILLVEDNIADIRFMEEAFKEADVSASLHSVMDGEAAINFLYKRDEFSDKPRPDLVILDLNIPKISGHEVLAFIKDDAKMRSIPVVVLTSSKSDEDIIRSYELQANCYIQKPLDLGGFINIVKSLDQFWFTVVKLPS